MIAVIEGRHVCYETTNGRDRRYLGCAHKTPREAIRHEVAVYVSPTRSVSPSYPRKAAGSAFVGGLTEASDTLPPASAPHSLGR